MISEKTKKIILVVAFISLVVGIGILLYFVFFRTTFTPEKVSPTIDTSSDFENLPLTGDGTPNRQDLTAIDPFSGLPQNDFVQIQESSPIANGGITKTEQLTNEPIADVTLTTNGILAYYNKDDGKFYRINTNGEREEISDKVFHNVKTVNWSKDGNKTILEYPDGSNIYYDFRTQQQVTLPKHWQEFNFNQSSTEIAFKELQDNADTAWLSTANPDGSGKKSIQHLGINADKTTVSYSPNNQIIGYYAEESGVNETRMFFIGKNRENYKAAVVNGYGIESQWNNKGDKLLYSAYSPETDFIPELWIVDAQGDGIGGNRINLGLRTSASKCNLTDQYTIYCAVPQNPSYGYGLEPDVDNDVADDIYKIDLRTGQKIKIAETDTKASINTLIVNQEQKTLFFTDKESNNLHKMKL